MGALFAEGFDFSGYNGSVPLLFLQGVLNFLFLGLYTNLGNTKAAAATGDYDEASWAEQAEGKALAVGAALNVAAPILGASPTSIGVQSSAASGDNGKSGLTSLAAAAFLGNIALGAALGCTAYVICKAAGKDRKELAPASILLGAVMFLFTIVTLL